MKTQETEAKTDAADSLAELERRMDEAHNLWENTHRGWGEKSPSTIRFKKEYEDAFRDYEASRWRIENSHRAGEPIHGPITQPLRPIAPNASGGPWAWGINAQGEKVWV
jgi:hypothetical protein